MYLLDTTDNKELTLIQQKEAGKPLVNKCRALLELWKEKNSMPKWEQVIEALRKVDLNQLATELNAALGGGQQGKVAYYMTLLIQPSGS